MTGGRTNRILAPMWHSAVASQYYTLDPLGQHQYFACPLFCLLIQLDRLCTIDAYAMMMAPEEEGGGDRVGRHHVFDSTTLAY